MFDAELRLAVSLDIGAWSAHGIGGMNFVARFGNARPASVFGLLAPEFFGMNIASVARGRTGVLA